MSTDDWEDEQRRRAAVHAARRLTSELREGALRDADLVVEVGTSDVTIDLRRVDHVDCVGLGALLEGTERLGRLGLNVKVLHANDRVGRILDLVGLEVDEVG